MSRDSGGKTKRELLMKAGLEIFSQKGFHNAKIEDIAHEAGIGKGTVYEYFRSKEHLFKEIIKEGMETYDALMRKEVNKARGTRAKLQEMIRQSITTCLHFRPLLRSVIAGTSLFDISFRNMLMQRHYQRLMFIKDIIDEGIAKKEIKPINALLFAKLFYGGIVIFVNPHEEINLQAEKIGKEETTEDIEEIIEEAVDYYLKGIM